MAHGVITENNSNEAAGERSILSTAMTVQAMRDSRYRHPANAVAELIDNAIDARADRVELLIKDHGVLVQTRTSYRIQSLAVIDNGIGMTAATLTQALRFGGRVPSPGIRKIGKYGMGLPTASASQCKRVEVWSWQEGIENAHYAYLDIDQIQKGTQEEILTIRRDPPEDWLSLAKHDIADCGTLVVWSAIDRIETRSDTIFRHVSEEIGRIYRHYINGGELTIRMASFRDAETKPHSDANVLPNDPLYLMAPSNTPGEWGSSPMFDDYYEETLTYPVNGRAETVDIKYSIVRQEALGNAHGYPGNTEYGRHAERNMGISVIRENREITLDDSMLNTEGGGHGLPQNRFWGCEVRFNQGCDDLFGIDHNKQMVSHFTRALKEVSQSGRTDTQIRDEIDANESDIHDIAERIRRTIRNMMREVHRKFQQRPTTRITGRPEEPTSQAPATPAEKAESLATDAIEESLRNNEIEKTRTDEIFEAADPVQKARDIAEQLTLLGYPEEQAKIEAEATVTSGYRYKLANASLSGSFVFEVETSPSGVLIVKLNINHPAYQYLQMLEDQTTRGNNTNGETAAIGLRLMILALARMDDEFQDPKAKRDFQNTCHQWGRIMEKLIDEDIVNVPE